MSPGFLRKYRFCVCWGSVMSDSLWLPQGGTIAPPGSSVHEFSRQEYWSGLPCPPPGYLPSPGIQSTPPASPAWLANSLPLSHLGSPNSKKILGENICIPTTDSVYLPSCYRSLSSFFGCKWLNQAPSQIRNTKYHSDKSIYTVFCKVICTFSLSKIYHSEMWENSSYFWNSAEIQFILI